MRALTLTLMLLCLALAGCSSVGDICDSDDDCGRGLRCTATVGARGVCTYAEGVADLAVKADLNTPDSGGSDLPQPDLGADQSTPDLPRPDQAAPDLSTPDLGEPDAVVPDAATPDALPDAAGADA